MCCVIVPIEPRSRTRWQPGRNPAGSAVASWFADTPLTLRPAARYPLTATAGHPRYDPIIKFGHYKVNQTKVPGRPAPMGQGTGLGAEGKCGGPPPGALPCAQVGLTRLALFFVRRF